MEALLQWMAERGGRHRKLRIARAQKERSRDLCLPGSLRDALRKGDEVASGILISHFAHSVECGALRLHDSGIFQRGHYGIEIVDLDVEKSGAFFRGFENLRHIVAEARERLIHHFGRALPQRDEAEL